MLQFNEVDATASVQYLIKTESRFSHFIREFCNFENNSLGYVEVWIGEHTKIRVWCQTNREMFCQVVDVPTGNTTIGRALSVYDGLEYLYHAIEAYKDDIIQFRSHNVMHNNMVFVY